MYFFLILSRSYERIRRLTGPSYFSYWLIINKQSIWWTADSWGTNNIRVDRPTRNGWTRLTTEQQQQVKRNFFFPPVCPWVGLGANSKGGEWRGQSDASTAHGERKGRGGEKKQGGSSQLNRGVTRDNHNHNHQPTRNHSDRQHYSMEALLPSSLGWKLLLVMCVWMCGQNQRGWGWEWDKLRDESGGI